MAKLVGRELEQVIKLVGLSPSCHPPGTLGMMPRTDSGVADVPGSTPSGMSLPLNSDIRY
jgi:hypothetical protein